MFTKTAAHRTPTDTELPSDRPRRRLGMLLVGALLAGGVGFATSGAASAHGRDYYDHGDDEKPPSARPTDDLGANIPDDYEPGHSIIESPGIRHFWPTDMCSGFELPSAIPSKIRKWLGGKIVPDSKNDLFDFRHACMHHDRCWDGQFQTTYRAGRDGELVPVTHTFSSTVSTFTVVSGDLCDSVFRNDMRSSCTAKYGKDFWSNLKPKKAACMVAADVYYEMVHSVGPLFVPSVGTRGPDIDPADATWLGSGRFNVAGQHPTADSLVMFIPNEGDDAVGTLLVATSDGETFDHPVAVRGPGIGRPDWARVGDFDGDGYDDIAWRHHRTLYTFNGAADFTTRGHTSVEPETWAEVGDFDGDGIDEIVRYMPSSPHSATGSIQISRNSWRGAIATFDHARGPGVGEPDRADVGDVNGDEIDDLAWQHGSTLFVIDGSDRRFSTVADHHLHRVTNVDTWGLADMDGDGRSERYVTIVNDGEATLMSFDHVGAWAFRPYPTEVWGHTAPALTIIGAFNGTSETPVWIR